MTILPRPPDVPPGVSALVEQLVALASRVATLEAQVEANGAEIRRLRDRADRGRRSGTPT